MIDELKQLIETSESILITSHLSPDADSLCSDILLYKVLRTNYPDKQVFIHNEDVMKSLSYLDDYDAIENGELSEAVEKHKPDLLIMLDANGLSRCTYRPEEAKKQMEVYGTKYAIIDHHVPIGRDESDVYINLESPAVTQDVYEIFLERLALKKPAGYAPIAMLGIYDDTGGFVYKNKRFKDTFRIAAQLVEDGADLEKIVHQLTSYSTEAIEALKELLKNLEHIGSCTYSFISDEFSEAWLAKGAPKEGMKEGFDIFIHEFMRNIDGRPWGFAVYPDLGSEEKIYHVSLRSMSGIVDVSEIARKLGGGGHKPAAAADIMANNAKQAVDAIKKAIESVK